MNEYQHLEFSAVDHPLTAKEFQKFLAEHSRRRTLVQSLVKVKAGVW